MNYAEHIGLVIFAGLASTVGMYVVRRRVSLETLAKHHEVGGLMFVQLGALYSVFLAFVVVAVWEHSNDAEEASFQESSILRTMIRLGSPLPEATRTPQQLAIVNYAKAVMSEEWETMADGKAAPTCSRLFHELGDCCMNFEPKTSQETVLYAELLRNLGAAREARTRRLFCAAPSVSGFMWTILLLVGALLLSMCYFFGLEQRVSQALMVAGFAASLTAILLLVYDLDAPFGGAVTVSPEIYGVVITGS